MPDAIVVGAGPNGLVAANLLADGHGYIAPLPFLEQGSVIATSEHPPGWPALLAVFSALGGTSYTVHELVGCAVGAWHLLRGRATPEVRTMFSMAMWMAALVAPVQILAGDQQGLNTLEHQPAKVLAMEGDFDPSPNGAPLVLFGLPSAVVEESTCQARGDDHCLYTITWDADRAASAADPQQLVTAREPQLAAMHQPQRRREHGLDADGAGCGFRKRQALGLHVLGVVIRHDDIDQARADGRREHEVSFD